MLLQLRAHKPQLLHLEVSITGFEYRIFGYKPNTVPTGRDRITIGSSVAPRQNEKNKG